MRIHAAAGPSRCPRFPLGLARYVSPRGSNRAPGTCARPWRSVQRALDRAQPDQTIFVRAGTYSQALTATRSGAAGAVITLRAYPGEHPELTGRLKIAGSYMRVSGFVFGGRTAANPSDVLIYVAGADNVEISHNELRHAARSAIYVGDAEKSADNIRIVGNFVHDNGTHANLDHGIYFGYANGGLIANNVITGNLSQGIKLAPRAYAAVVADNTVVGNGNSGILVGGDDVDISSGNLIVNNIVARNADWGIRTYWESAGVGAGNRAWQNVVWGNRSGASWFPGGGLDESDSILARPAFVAANDYHLAPGSPAIGAADPSFSQPTDYEGRRRTTPDIGAFEH